jgi:hypothetical protein
MSAIFTYKKVIDTQTLKARRFNLKLIFFPHVLCKFRICSIFWLTYIGRHSTSIRTVNLIYVQYRELLLLDYCPSYLETSQRYFSKPIPVAAWSKEWAWSRSLAWIADLSPACPVGCLSLLSVLCCQVEPSEMGRSLFQRSPTAYVFVCHWVWSGAIPSTPTVSTHTSEWEREVCVSFT